MQNVAICDKNRGAVFEITTKNVVVRSAVEGICVCTNHFQTKKLATSTESRRYDVLSQSRKLKKLSVADVAKQMHAVNLGKSTRQTMVFEPSSLKLHLAFGKGPATRLPLRTLEPVNLLNVKNR